MAWAPPSSISRVTSSMNSGTPPVRTTTPSIASAESVSRSGNDADHLAHLAEIERNKRNDAMMRPGGPGRAKFGARRRNDHQGRGSAAFGEDLQQIERGRVGPVEVFEGEHKRLRVRACKQPGDHRGQLAAAQLLGRQLRGADGFVGNIKERCE